MSGDSFGGEAGELEDFSGTTVEIVAAEGFVLPDKVDDTITDTRWSMLVIGLPLPPTEVDEAAILSKYRETLPNQPKANRT